VEESVRDDLTILRASPLIPDDIPIRGFVYDVRTGRLSEVSAQARQRAQVASGEIVTPLAGLAE
jgi:carbonic anhydrase